MADLKQWAKDNNPNLQMSDGDTVIAKYLGFQIVPDSFNPGKEKVQYTLEVEGKPKFFKSGSGKTAMFFAKLQKNDFVKIVATGEGLKRRYEFIESLDESGQFTRDDKKIMEEEMAG